MKIKFAFLVFLLLLLSGCGSKVLLIGEHISDDEIKFKEESKDAKKIQEIEEIFIAQEQLSGSIDIPEQYPDKVIVIKENKSSTSAMNASIWFLEDGSSLIYRGMASFDDKSKFYNLPKNKTENLKQIVKIK